MISRGCARVLCLQVIVLTLALTAAGKEPEIRFDHITVEDGLPERTIYQMTQDHLGFIWLGTQDGVVRYDGDSFVSYKQIPGDPHSLQGRLVLEVAEDRERRLWIGTFNNGLNRYDRDLDRFISYRHDPDNANSLSYDGVSAVYQDSHGVVWVGCGVPEEYGTEGGLNRYVPEHDHFIRYEHDPDDPASLSPGPVTSILESRNGQLWIATFGGGLNLLDRKTMTFTHLQHDAEDSTSLNDNRIYELAEDQQGRLWLATHAGGLNRYEQGKGFKHYRHDPEDPTSLSCNRVLSLCEDSQGFLWAGTSESDLNRYDPDIDGFVHYRHDPTNPASLSKSMSIWDLYQDRTGVLWVAARGSGLDKADLYATRFKHWIHDPHDQDSLSTGHVVDVLEDSSGKLWAGTMGGGVNRIDVSTGAVTRYPSSREQPGGFGGTSAYTIHEGPTGTLWFGSNGGLNRYQPATDSFFRYPYSPDNPKGIGGYRVAALLEDSPGSLWIGLLGGGLDHLDVATGSFTHYRKDPDDPFGPPGTALLALVMDRNGALWIGSEDAGLSRLDPATGEMSSFRSPESGLVVVTALLEDRQDRLWVGTYNGGLHLFDPVSGTSSRVIDQRSGLPHNGVHGITEDDEGRLWLCTGTGPSRYDPASGEIISLDHRDGIKGDWVFSGLIRSSWGELYFSGTEGLYAFFPDHLGGNPYPPQVVLTGLRVADQELKASTTGPLSRQISVTESIALRHDQGMLSFTFAALHYSHPTANQIAFRLEPLEQAWIDAGTQRQATYLNLAPGEYTFKVNAANSNGVWNLEGASIRISISPPWWKSWWAYALYLVLIIAGLAGAERIHSARLLRRERFERGQIEARLRAEAAELEARALRAEFERKTRELEDARQLQLSMLPTKVPIHPTVELAATMQPATEVGGDYYDFDLAEDGTLTVAIGDATGHGTRAGLMVTVAKSLFNFLRNEPDVVEVMRRSTAAIKRMNLGSLHMAMMLVRHRDRSIEIANAGMPPALVWRAASQTIEEISLGSVPLGSIVDFPYQKATVEVEPGDTVVLMTDGLPEITNHVGEMLGYERVSKAVGSVHGRSPEAVIEHLLQVGHDWSAGRAASDDMTFVVLRVSQL
jgi:ligand-binding sensor domain-containing protein/serine phosphatase RsbU (regulator of sigma subunit)